MNFPPEKIEEARTLWKQGVQRKMIAKMLDLSERTVGRMCEGLDKPVEHRGVYKTLHRGRFVGRSW
jgi:hypothetical protein